MSDERLDAIRAVAELWLAAPTDEPLVLDRDEHGAVFLSRGIPASRLTKAQAARMLGIAYNTLQSRYISRGKLHVGQDGKIALLALRRLMSRLDGKD